jgi:hypothetical protein
LFLVVHALRRYHQDQGNVTIQFLDRRKAKTPDGSPAKFFSAFDIYTIYNVPKWPGWGHTDHIKLQPRKFTQEYLTHGPVLTPDTILKQARVEDLIADGLYEMFPEFEAPEDHKRSGLYTLQVVHHKIGYLPAPHVASVDNAQIDTPDAGTHTAAIPESAASSSPQPSISSGVEIPAGGTAEALAAVPSPDAATADSSTQKSKPKKVIPPIYSYHNCARQKPMTVGLLTTVRKVTLNFLLVPKDADMSAYESPLHAFICFLTSRNVQKKTRFSWIGSKIITMVSSPP